MKNLDLSKMSGVLFYQGDLDIQASQRPYCFCIAVSEHPAFNNLRGLQYFVQTMSAATDAGLFPPERRLIEGSATSGLIGSGRIDIDGRFRMSSQLGDLGDLRLVTSGRELGWRVIPDVDLVATFAWTYLAKTGGQGIPLGDESKQLCESVLRDTGQGETMAALRAAAADLPADEFKRACERLVQQVWPDSPQLQPGSATPSPARQEKRWWEFWR